jgi:hypothetical protein
METLNAELDAAAEKLAVLSEATAVYLEKVTEMFEKTDKALAQGME